MKIKYLLIPIYLLISLSGQGTEFCVKSSAGLQMALTNAQNNMEDDVIKIKVGSYITPGTHFSYDESGGFNLDISGGWSGDFPTTCDQQNTTDSLSTQLDGNNVSRVLIITSVTNAQIKLSNLAFINGMFNGSGGGLSITSFPNSQINSITLENNTFIGNQARFGGALYLLRGLDVVIRNNIFVDNHSTTNRNLLITQEGAAKLYFTNNSVMNNSTDTELPGGVNVQLSGTIANALIANNIIWGNDNGDIELAGQSNQLLLQNNNIGNRTGSSPSVNTGNFSLPPRFDQGTMNYTPSTISPLVNKGKESCTQCPDPIPFEENWTLGDFDVDGNTRNQQGRVDIGAVESPYMPDLIFMHGFE